MKSMSIKNSLISIFTIIFIAVFPHSGLINFFPFIYTIPVIILVWLSLKINKETFTDIGFAISKISIRSLVIGGITAILSLLFLRLIFFPILESVITFESVEVDLYTQLKGNTTYYIFILIMSALVGGVYEEIVFHAFIYTRLEKMIKGKYKTFICFLITSLIFGLYHYQLGVSDTINAFLMGVSYLGLFLFFKRNLWYSIFCHIIYNSIVITLLYLGYI